MSGVQRLLRYPNLILGVVTSGLSLLVLFGVHLTADQMAGVGVFLGAVIALLTVVTTPASEVVAQRKAGKDQVTAGPAATVSTGTLVDVTVAPRPPVGTPAAQQPDERGAASPWIGTGGVLVLLVVVALVLLL